MLLEAYQSIKTQIEAKVPGIKYTDWFNDQYSGTIHTAPACFIEFPNPLEFKTLRREFQQAQFTVRIHLASKAYSDQAKRIDPALIAEHENLTQQIFYAISGLGAMYNPSQILFTSLQRTSYEHHQYMKGWLMTTQDFVSLIYQHHQTEPTGEINTINITTNVRQ